MACSAEADQSLATSMRRYGPCTRPRTTSTGTGERRASRSTVEPSTARPSDSCRATPATTSSQPSASATSSRRSPGGPRSTRNLASTPCADIASSNCRSATCSGSSPRYQSGGSRKAIRSIRPAPASITVATTSGDCQPFANCTARSSARSLRAPRSVASRMLRGRPISIPFPIMPASPGTAHRPVPRTSPGAASAPSPLPAPASAARRRRSPVHRPAKPPAGCRTSGA